MKTSELRLLVKKHGGGEAGIMRVIEMQNERINVQQQEIKELGLQLLSAIKIVEQLTTAGGAMREQIEKMQGLKEDDDDLPDAHH